MEDTTAKNPTTIDLEKHSKEGGLEHPITHFDCGRHDIVGR